MANYSLLTVLPLLSSLVLAQTKSAGDHEARFRAGQHDVHSQKMGRSDPAQLGGKTEKTDSPLPPEFMLYSLSGDSLKSFEVTQMVQIIQNLYQLDSNDLSQAQTFAQRVQTDHWNGVASNDSQQWNELTESRLQYSMNFFSEHSSSSISQQWAQLMGSREFREINKKINDIEHRYPWSFMERLTELEPLLPAAKVAEARKEWNKRRGRLSREIAISGLLEQGTARSAASASNPAAQAKPVPRSAASNMKAQSNNPAGAQKPAVASARPQVVTPPNNPHNPRSTNVPPPPNGRPGMPAGTPANSGPTRPLNEWERYVQEFITRYDLDASQTNAALSILRDLTARAVQIQKVNDPKMVAANQMTDPRQKQKYMDDLKRPIDDLFYELQRRLNGLPTAAQLTKGGGQTPGRR